MKATSALFLHTQHWPFFEIFRFFFIWFLSLPLIPPPLLTLCEYFLGGGVWCNWLVGEWADLVSGSLCKCYSPKLFDPFIFGCSVPYSVCGSRFCCLTLCSLCMSGRELRRSFNRVPLFFFFSLGIILHGERLRKKKKKKKKKRDDDDTAKDCETRKSSCQFQMYWSVGPVSSLFAPIWKTKSFAVSSFFFLGVNRRCW